MIWIEIRKGEAIPKELLYEGCQNDTDKYIFHHTPLMQWIDWRKGEAIPKEL